MGLFRHPHLVRGIVHTSEGAFQIERGIADLPDEVGAALGWIRVDEDPTSDPAIGTARVESRGGGQQPRRRAVIERPPLADPHRSIARNQFPAAQRSSSARADAYVTGILKVLRTYSMLARVSAIRSLVGESVSSTYQPR